MGTLILGPAGQDPDVRKWLDNTVTKLATLKDRLNALINAIYADYSVGRRTTAPTLTPEEETEANDISTELDTISSDMSKLEPTWLVTAPPTVTPTAMPTQQPGEADDIFQARQSAWAFLNPIEAGKQVNLFPTDWAHPIKALGDFWAMMTKPQWQTQTSSAVIGAEQGAASVITEMFGGATFAAFILEEALQAAGLGAWVAYGAGEYDVADTTLDTQEQILQDYWRILALLRPLMPMTYPAFLRFGIGASASNAAIRQSVSAKRAAAAPGTTGTLHISSSPSGATILLNGKTINKLTPQTVKYLSPGTYTVDLTLPASAKFGVRTGSATATVKANATTEILVPLTEAPPVTPQAPAPTPTP